jgi:hypothetical protein
VIETSDRITLRCMESLRSDAFDACPDAPICPVSPWLSP